ncbi:hypothetical protein MLD38_008174 [Melastoma candidum]|uniref:Uncharacterized protein n=1 Tax=Melastoma candidum TaxID=119954 RepID=A0ACB9S205_9MYRT|nr:hypothetical protein MLD38_008174 [Melastoma candidum]
MLLKQAAVSHNDVAESIRSLADADPAHRKIFVHGLGWDATAETLTSVFSNYGEIEECKHVTDRKWNEDNQTARNVEGRHHSFIFFFLHSHISQKTIPFKLLFSLIG